uniref:Uncharacterized protein n=1 Tax=Bracon brevicornis TaxID=1563983 RepID=A0A6V7JAT1_9HYME
MKNGKEFNWSAYADRMVQLEGQGTLLISVPIEEDAGQYECYAENQWGIATSNLVFLREAELRSFNHKELSTYVVYDGSPFRLHCEPPYGSPKPIVHWVYQDPAGVIRLINDSRITNDPDGNLWFSNTTLGDVSKGFHYCCAVTSLVRNEYKIGDCASIQVASEEGQLSSREPVLQYVSETNQTAIKGKRHELFCIYAGSPLPAIVWMKNGVKLEANDRISFGNFGKSVIFKSVDFKDEGNYTCEASNGVGSAKTHSIDLKVMAIPYFTVEPESQIVADGESVEFRCEVHGIPQPRIQWIHNGKLIEEAPENPRRTVSANRIFIKEVTKNDTGNYGCEATNSYGYVYKDVYVNVLALGPNITRPPMNEIVADGKTFTMTCHVFGAPKPQVKWFKDGVELTGGRYRTHESGDLEIINAFFPDTGHYTCRAFNKFGQAEASADLEVVRRTRIIERPEDVGILAGGIATFRCNAISDPSLALQINWLRNGELIDTEIESRFVIALDSSLRINKVNELDSGVYSCWARTEIDGDTANATLTVQGPPNPPLLTQTKCYDREATISWQPTGDNRSPIYKYSIEYTTSFTPDSWSIVNEFVSATEQSFNISMSPWANYTFRVIAWNKVGPSKPSAHSTVCSTQPDVPFENPSDVVGEGTTPENLVISWSVMPQVQHNGPNFKYRVSYKRDIPGASWINEDINDWKINRLEINNQPTYERYKIKVMAINEMGESRVAPDIVIGYSGEDQPTEAPGNLTLIGEPTSTTAELSWSPVSPESVRGLLRGYKFQIWTEEDGESGMKEIDVIGANTTHAIINKFVPNSKNFVRAVAYNGRFNGPPSATISFDTLEGTPGPVSNLDAHPTGSNGLLLSWTKPAEPNGKLTGYQIYYEVVYGTDVGPTQQRPDYVDADATSALLSNLRERTRYRIFVIATTAAGRGLPYYIEASTN